MLELALFPSTLRLISFASDLFPISFFTGTTGLLGGKGGGTPLPKAGFLFVEAAESIKGFRVVVELGNNGTVGFVMWALLGFDTPS